MADADRRFGWSGDARNDGVEGIAFFVSRSVQLGLRRKRWGLYMKSWKQPDYFFGLCARIRRDPHFYWGLGKDTFPELRTASASATA
jgi:hypothetical protein